MNIKDVSIIESLSQFESMIATLGITGERVTPANIVKRIKTIEFCKYETHSGKILRWCIITMVNEFGITSPVPSCSVSIENDNEIVGKRAALESALANIWQFEGYLLSTQRMERAKGIDTESQIAKLGRIMEGEFGGKVGSFIETYLADDHHTR